MMSFGVNPAQTKAKGRHCQVELQSKLRDIVNVYADLQTHQRRCLKEYPTWSQMRQESIEKLQSVAHTVEAHKKDCEIAKLTGATVSLIGDAVSAYGAFSSPSQKDEDKSNASKTMMKTGHTGSLLGGFITAGATIIEAMIENEKAREVKRILETDQNESSALMEFKSTAEKFKGLVEEIMDFNVFQRVIKGFRTLKSPGKSNRRRWEMRHHVLPYYIVDMIRHLHLHAGARARVEDFTRVLHGSNDHWDMFQTLVTLNSNDSFVFPAVSLIGESSRDYLHAFNGPVVSLPLAYENAVAWRKGNDDTVSQDIISVVGVAMDVINIMNTFEARKSPSEFVKYIQRSAKLMQDEMNMWQKIYRLYLRNFD